MWNAELEGELETVTSSWRARGLARSAAKLDVSRVSQLDALMLDDELLALLKTHAGAVLACVPALEQRSARYQPEMMALLRAIVWIFSYRVNEAPPGDALQNLRYRNEGLFDEAHKRGLLKLPGDGPTRLQRLLHGAGAVVVPWVWERLEEHSLVHRWSSLDEDDWRHRAAKIMDKAERVYVLANLANFVLFLHNGRYRSLLDRLLQMRVVYATKEAHRPVSFEFINQQLLYDGFSDMLMCVLPLVDWTRLQRFGLRSVLALFSFYKRSVAPWLRFLRKRMLGLLLFIRAKIRRARRGSAISEDPNAQEDPLLTEAAADGEPAEDDAEADSDDPSSSLLTGPAGASACVVCAKSPACMPHETNCGHHYCYYCLKTTQMQASEPSAFVCVRCDEPITRAKRL
ncbi:Peroxisome biosis factor 2 [Hondaea fermentalgiana]|uniref:RING-type E3 ubiquitin transferase (cysteine targeting) n=1 Tax=Hondaea fermentalgiana TaxID=2315210 RepID=A0A2R5GGB0_9STRA|nr:Peroxisome biosis factor 2 [Hondaea fermentalgiana]|eukprot:GBG27291.1 Peroxisome biosis factor 2 [Hondaea fermentalgiana]